MIVEQFYILDHYSKKNFKKINNIIENLLDLVGGANVTYVKEYPKIHIFQRLMNYVNKMLVICGLIVNLN